MALRGGLANTGAVRRAGHIGAGFVRLARAFSWFVLLVVLFVVRSSGRSFCGSFFWFVLLGARMCFLFDALKVLEACVARSEVS